MLLFLPMAPGDYPDGLAGPNIRQRFHALDEIAMWRFCLNKIVVLGSGPAERTRTLMLTTVRGPYSPQKGSGCSGCYPNMCIPESYSINHLSSHYASRRTSTS